ncbi:peptidase M14 [Metabacillus sp. GX 13764]|uniref:M14 family zinc carboxypeptidase n=1 Tax=Metabacillus kandeliae TaxID=2900151 RepID=UPI001E2B6F19|nr:M14 family zinc carboxypeptidase [Metabacillus kandeliae]MCD7035355.1 peptidase M14 [Metabacillus kandeliae]
MKNLWKTMLLSLVIFAGFGFINKANAAYSVNPNQIYTYEKMAADIKGLAAAYPDLIHYKVIGKSEYGRNIYAVSIGKGSAHAYLNASHHAREWLTTNLNMYMLDQYAKNYVSGGSINGLPARTILNQTTIWFTPMVNPDGVTLQQYGTKKFPSSDRSALIKMNDGRTDFKRWKANAKGVDLNRQYDAYWADIEKNTGRPSYMNFKGYSPASAAETKAVLKFTEEIKPEMAVSYHTSGQILYWNFHQQGAIYSRDLSYAKQLGKMTGYTLVYPGPNPSGGGYTDWFILRKQKPAFTIEIGRYNGETSLPLSEFGPAWEQNKDVGLYIAKESYQLMRNRAGNAAEKTAAEISNLVKSSKSLEPYYSTRVKSLAYLYIPDTFMNIYNQSDADVKKADQLAASLPEPYKSAAVKQIADAKEYRLRAARFIDGIRAGDLVKRDAGILNTSIQKDVLNAQTVAQYETLTSQLAKSEKIISRVYGGQYRDLFREKYITPSKIARETVIFEISRYLLLQEIQQLKKNQGSPEIIQEKTAVYHRLEVRSVKIKEEGNKLHPGMYPDLPGFETVLDQMAAEILS